MDFIKRNALIVGIIVLIVLGFGGYLAWSFSQSKPVVPQGIEEEPTSVRTMDSEEIGLELSLRPDKKAVAIKAAKVSGIRGFEYELTYDAEVLDGRDAIVVPRGVVGELNIRGGVAQAEAYLGTCSANVCKPDKVVSSVKVVIRVNFENGEIGAVEDTISLE
jgi:hypothetical protein